MSSRGSLRLSGGTYRGRRLKVGKDLRPTEARVREALFSMWSEDLAEARFLDLFAGTGAISLEAEGRGAQEVVAVDQKTELLAGNLAVVGAQAVRVVEGELPAVLKRLEPNSYPEPYDLIFADPPYGYRAYEVLLAAIAPLLAPTGELALEHSARRPMPAEVSNLLRVDQRRYGETLLSFYRPAAT